MDAAVAERHGSKARPCELRSRAAEARRAAAEEQQRSAVGRQRAEMGCDRTAAVLTSLGGRPIGDRDGRFLLGVGRSRPLVRFVRHDFRRWLEQADLPAEGVSEVVLACSEACANAVEHPHGAERQLVEVEAALDGRQLELRIRDFGLWKEQPGSPLRGRGLDMIRGLMDSLDVHRTVHGTEVVMRRSLST
jgi:anti-sigma regulatory factor (Ser/Thr protein kinase)